MTTDNSGTSGSPWILNFAFYCPQAMNPAISSHSQGDDRLVTINSSCRLRIGLCIIPQGAPFLIGCLQQLIAHGPLVLSVLIFPTTRLSPQKKQQVRSHTQIFFPSRRRSLPPKLSFLRPSEPPVNVKLNSIDETGNSASLR